MLRVEAQTGWWLITHPDHARLAAQFGAHWGNAVFAPPEPRAEVLEAIAVHDDGWIERDTRPEVTRQGRPSAFSRELVGKYSAFEEIDLAEYLAVREQAVRKIEQRSAYAALLVSMHTYNLLTERADRSTIADLDLLDGFLARQLARQQELRRAVQSDSSFTRLESSDERILANFQLLQAVDNLSLVSCVDHAGPASLLHPLRTLQGSGARVEVDALASRVFRLLPYPFREPMLQVTVGARHVTGRVFADSTELQARFAQAPVVNLAVTITE